jgi:pilus assembly protein Flp/PilA
MFDLVKTSLMSLKSDRRGVTALEYGLIAGVMAVGLVAAFQGLGTKISAAFTALTF